MKKFNLSLLLLVWIPVCVYSQFDIDTVKIDIDGKDILLTGYDSIGVEYLYVEKTPVDAEIAALDPNLPEDAIVYRLFVDLKEVSYLNGGKPSGKLHRFTSCMGIDWEDIPLVIKSTEPFFNHELGGATASSQVDQLIAAFPSLAYDTYVTDGTIGSSKVGVPKTVNPEGFVPITPETTPIQDLTVPNSDLIGIVDGSSMEMSDKYGFWGIAGGMVGPDTTTNIVFIGQFTTAGKLTMNLHIQIGVVLGSQVSPKNEIYYIPNISYSSISAPAVSITSHQNNDTITVGEPITLVASAQDSDGDITSVEFFIGENSLGAVSAAPYQIEWTPENTGAYAIYAIATDNDTLSTNSEPVNLIVKNTTEVEKILFSQYSIYPNPAKEKFIVEYLPIDEVKSIGYIIYDALGNSLLSKDLEESQDYYQFTVRISELPNGFYTFKLMVNGISSIKQIIKE